MNPTRLSGNKRIRCEGCSRITPRYDLVHYLSTEHGSRQLCSQCLNGEVAKAEGLEGFQHTRFDPIQLADCTGEVHEFHFRTNLFGPGVALDAFELRDENRAGYQFQVIGNPEDDPLTLLGRLISKIRLALSTKHLVGGAGGLQIADDRVVRGIIGWDDAHDGRLPLLTIDGREISWNEFGGMLTTFEGWQFRLMVYDKSEEP